jgi:hypothetical protein
MELISTKTYIEITNKGLIEPEDLKMLGATTKQGDSNKIGYFGSGTKFSLAYLIRNNIEFHIFRGLEEIDIKAVPQKYRNQDIKVLYINGEPTSITDRFGVDWEPWFILREFYSNALDEGDSNIVLVNKLKPLENITTIYIEATSEFMDIYNNINSYFVLDRKNIYQTNLENWCLTGSSNIEIYHNCNSELYDDLRPVTIYRRGIKCNTANILSYFDLNIDGLSINESRVLVNEHHPAAVLGKIIKGCTNYTVLSLFVRQLQHKEKRNTLAYRATNYLSEDTYSKEWKTICENYIFYPEGTEEMVNLLSAAEDLNNVISPKPYVFINSSMYNSLLSQFPDEVGSKNLFSFNLDTSSVSIKPSDLQLDTLKAATDKLKSISYTIPRPIKLVSFIDKSVLGTYDAEFIYVSDTALDEGVTETILTIVEETEHISSGFRDETRNFQTHLLTKYVRYMFKSKNQIL